MLFNTYQFIFFFLPIVFFGFFWIARFSYRMAALWLAVASIFFYGYWNPKFVSLLVASIIFNYYAGFWIGQSRLAKKSKPILIAAIGANLLLLGIFKYTNFFILTANMFNAEMDLLDIVLPLGISFFTFTQIAFLIDTHRGVSREYNFIHYLLFVTWFPHLIAGPVLHHKEMMPQFALPTTFRPSASSIAIGLTFFSLGLFKKVVLADQFALYANPVFNAVADGGKPMLFEAWIGALAYTFQLYFDFSGYSDMAIGLSSLFNINLPINFNSPYKAANIIDFWRRWHITLSTFLRDYLYFSLGGNRKGPVRRYFNIVLTMLLGGLWHGAGWNFVVWGGLHGIYLVINHSWKTLLSRFGSSGGQLIKTLSLLITFACVVIAWVPFRSENFDVTQAMLSGMSGLNGVSVSPGFAYFGNLGSLCSINGWAPLTRMPIVDLALWLTVGFLIVWTLPNTQQWLAYSYLARDKIINFPRFGWKPTPVIAVLVGAIFGFSLLCLNRVSEFLYFQF
jgi:alginate O-acetyltransferase complex protein AlgI